MIIIDNSSIYVAIVVYKSNKRGSIPGQDTSPTACCGRRCAGHKDLTQNQHSSGKALQVIYRDK